MALCTAFLLVFVTMWAVETAARNATALDILPDSFYTLHQDDSRVSLEVKEDGSVNWDPGSPTLFSVLQERVVRSSELHGGLGQERMFALEASATQHWICMRAKGRVYTVHRPNYYKVERQKRIRHLAQKRKRPRWASTEKPSSILEDVPLHRLIPPPKDCLFKTYEFDPNESYERSVAIYSFPHSNDTHARFLALNQSTGTVRSQRKPFHDLNLHGHLKMSQVPVRHLHRVVTNTRFSGEREVNRRVRQCILTLFGCPHHQDRLGGEKGAGRHFYRIIQRCKRRAGHTEKMPRCGAKGRRKNRRSSSQQPRRRRGRRRRRRRRRKLL